MRRTSLFTVEPVFCVILFLSASIQLARPAPCDPDVPSRAVPNAEPEMAAVPLRCDEGQYLESNRCLQCPEGTFMTRKMAEDRTHQHCLKCHEPVMYEIVFKPCSKTRDTEIMCEDEFYRTEIPEVPCGSHCKQCDVCGVGKNMFKNFERRECQGYNNTVCCKTEDTIMVGDKCVQVTTVRTTSTTTTSTPGPAPKEYDVPDSDILLAVDELSVGASRNGATLLHLQYTYMLYLLCVLYNLMGLFIL